MFPPPMTPMTGLATLVGLLSRIEETKKDPNYKPPEPVKPYVPIANRNDTCPCGSGKKYKKCCRAKLKSGKAFVPQDLTKDEAAAVEDSNKNPPLIPVKLLPTPPDREHK